MHTAENMPVYGEGHQAAGMGLASAIATVIDLEGNVQYANDTARELCEMIRGYRDVKHVSEFGGDGQVLLDYMEQVLQRGEHCSTVCRIEFRDVRGGECLPAELYYLQMFPVSGGKAVGQVIQPLRGVTGMANDLLDEYEEDAGDRLIRIGGRSVRYSGECSQR
jgi:hypothetical protein